MHGERPGVQVSEHPSPAAGMSRIHSTDKEGVRRLGKAHQSEIKSTVVGSLRSTTLVLAF